MKIFNQAVAGNTEVYGDLIEDHGDKLKTLAAGKEHSNPFYGLKFVIGQIQIHE